MMKAERIQIGNWNLEIYNPFYSPSPANLPDLSNADDWWESAHDTWSNGVGNIYRWSLADGQYLYVDCAEGTYPACASISTEADIAQYLLDWDHDCDGTEWLADWDIEPELAEAAENFPGPCRVWHRPHYYQGTYNAPRPRWARDEDGVIIEFADYAEAAEYVHDYYHAPSAYDGIPACNVMAHGQAGADTLTICEA